MAGRRNPAVRNTLYLLTRAFFSLTRIVPLPLARGLGIGLAAVAYHCLPRVKRVGRANLELAYGDTLTGAEKRRILRESVRNLGLVAAEFSHLPGMLAHGIPPRIQVKGLDLVDSARGAILMGAHHGNWELMLPLTGRLGLKVAAVVRDFDDPRMNTLVSQVRSVPGVTLISKKKAMASLLSEIRSGSSIGLLADQNPRENAAPVTFFGRQTWASIDPALLAMRAGAPVHPVAVTRIDHSRYVLEFFPALELVRSGNFIQDLQENTQRCQDAIETLVRACPGQWLWLHRRWKPRAHLAQVWEAREKKEASRRHAEASADKSSSS